MNNIPEAGKIARVRGRLWLINDVSFSTDTTSDSSTLVTLESLEDSDLGSKLSVIKEREIDFEILPDDIIPEIGNRLDHPDIFDSFVNALRWSNKRILNNEVIRAPFYGSIKQRSFQLEPVVKALSMARINLLIADDVGLGKTIEAGMITQELILRGKARRILLVCPASLQLQWQWEMEHKFGLDFQIIDSKKITEFKREYGINVNPWLAYPRLITSIDFMKMEGRKNEFLRSCESISNRYIRPWDLLIVDEAHNAIPQPTKNYYKDSERTKLIYEITRHFEHKIFLTATPHNGQKKSFVAFLDMIDPLNFNRGEDPDIDRESFKKRLKRIMIRRLKRGPNCVKDSFGKPLFPDRTIKSLVVSPSEKEQNMLRILNDYIKQRMENHSDEDSKRRPLEFALTILKKRLLSSPRAFYNSIIVHANSRYAEGDSEKYLQLLVKKLNEDWDDDIERDQLEQELLGSIESKSGDSKLTDLISLSKDLKDTKDCKIEKIIEWVNNNLKDGNKWNNERLVIFTEYKDTLDYIVEQLMKSGVEEERIIQLYGGMEMQKRESIKEAFEIHPEESPARILVATDAASEGINLQYHCRYMIHMEIPWNPIRLEQRNGRIDRHGQNRNMKIYHFVYQDDADSRFLNTIVEKVEQIREDIETINPVIEEKVQKHMLKINDYGKDIINTMKDKMTSALLETKEEIREITNRMEESREKLNLHPDAVKELLNSALRLNGAPEIVHVGDNKYKITKLPSSWRNLNKYISKDGKQTIFTFKHSDNRRVEQLHPNHPLLKKAIAFFRSNIWSKGFDEFKEHKMNKVTCKEISSERITEPHVIFYTRILALNELSQPLVEEVKLLGGRFSEGDYVETSPELLAKFDKAAKFNEETSKLLPELSKVIKNNNNRIINQLNNFKKNWTGELKNELKEKTDEEINNFTKMIKERIKEVNKTVEKLKKYQHTMFEDEEQYSQDIKLLSNRIEYLNSQLSNIPEKVKKKFSLKEDPMINVVAMCFLIPGEMIR